MAFVLRILHGVHAIYANVTDTIRLIKSNGKGSFLRKHTLKMHVFRIVPIPTEDHYLLGMKWQGMYYYDRCLPMGPASSCKTIELFSTAAQWVGQQKLLIDSILHLLEEFLLVSPSYAPVKLN